MMGFSRCGRNAASGRNCRYHNIVISTPPQEKLQFRGSSADTTTDSSLQEDTKCWISNNSLPNSSSEDTQTSLSDHPTSTDNLPSNKDWRSVWIWPSNELSQCQTHKFRRRRYILYAVAIFSVILAGFAYWGDTKEILYDKLMNLAPGSYLEEIWKNPPVNVYMKMYIFNITNPEEFSSGKEKLRVEEIGPFTYIEKLLNTDVVYHDNGTVSYTPVRTIAFQKDMSVDDPKNIHVVVPNLAYLGLASMLTQVPSWAYYAIVSALSASGLKPILNLTAHEYFFGYDDPLVTVANTVVGNIVTFSKLGLIDRMYDEGHNRISMRLNNNGLDPLDPGYLQKYSIVDWNGSPGLAVWGYKSSETAYDQRSALHKCKFLRGTTEGVVFPRNLNRKEKLYIYRKSFCRHTPIEFKYEGTFMPGVRANWYGMPEDTFKCSSPEQRCYCDPDKADCPQDGLSPITPCYYHIPTATSFPHFYKSDPSLLEQVDGLSPNKEKHESYAVIQPELGAMLDAKSKMQTNLVLGNLKYRSELAPFANKVIPMVWVNLEMDKLGIDSILGLYSLLIVLPVLHYITIILGVLSAVYLLCTLVLIFRNCLYTNNNRIHITRNVLASGVSNTFPEKFTSCGTVPG